MGWGWWFDFGVPALENRVSFVGEKKVLKLVVNFLVKGSGRVDFGWLN